MNILQSKHIVLLGGGTGNAVFLRSLKKYTEHISVIVTVADDGGSSGKLRTEYGILPPGDIRNCIVALAEEENIMAELMDFRFGEGFMKQHSFGNIFIAAMNAVTGNFPLAVRKVSDVLAIHGEVFPVTDESVTLRAVLSDGQMLEGESKIPAESFESGRRIDHMEIEPQNVHALPEVLAAIANADIILYSPGSLYTSLIPNLLVNGICEAIEASNAEKYYVANIMTQHGETDGFSVGDHIRAIEKHTRNHKIIDTILYNTSEIPRSLLKSYRAEQAEPVKFDADDVARERYECVGLECAEICADAFGDAKRCDQVIRHNSDLIWRYIMHRQEV